MLTPILLILCSVLLGICMCLLITAFLARSRILQKKKELATLLTLQKRIALALQEDASPSSTTFNNTLDQAVVTSGFQAPRMQARIKVHRDPPEKYRILPRLASQGMESNEIAAILGISTVEADQLVNLHRMTDNRS